MDKELAETLAFIISRYEGRTTGSVFIPISDFSWHRERNGQLTRLKEYGMINSLLFFDNGAEITLTQNGWHFFDKKEKSVVLDKSKIYEILSVLSIEMKKPKDNFGFDAGSCMSAIKQLQEQGYIAGAKFQSGGWDPNPKIMWIDNAYVTVKGLNFIEDYKKNDIDLTSEFISACSKIADNPASYTNFDENGLNREIRNYIDSAISRFGYTIADQSQQGLGESDVKPGQLDILIKKNGIPIAIYEGLIHKDKQYLFGHIEKAIGRYNGSGCKAVYIVEFSRNKRFGSFWDNTCEVFDEITDKVMVKEENTSLIGVRLLKGTYKWEDRDGEFYYFGVNCFYAN